jgi:phosphate transport system substrate-binding protein
MQLKEKKTARILSALLAAGIALGPQAAQGAIVVNGAGATFPYPIYSKWFDEYHKMHPDVEINYQSIGSGGGIKQVTAHTVDFGASDGPMTTQQLLSFPGKILHFPTVLGAVVPIYNLPGVSGEVKLTGPVLADIYLGKITRWDSAALKELNPDIQLPDAPIVVIHRSDGSGTSYCFTDYLSKISPEWKSKVGKGTAVNWPTGLGGKGNEGVAGIVKETPNSLGYVELIYALQNKLNYASVQNKAGKFLKGSVEGVTAAAASVANNMPKDFRVSITDAPGEDAYPISTFTWLLVFQSTGGEKGRILKDFLSWMVNDGQKFAPALGYAPLPDSVREMEKKTIESVH